ncbi:MULTISPECIES: AraC family transcriptional regulator [Niastella]|uniref:Helix-turn-helix domain-containing protein n=1 Tax=Niastella soli TaxID=2821487 RepID=A0ABS3Z1C8_9BACT|nr:AraC family transcriptional regulator [Niastella soli]MBO9203201.1 helix-turn-helix domain-containing protein [Niastella soli]
MIDNKSIKQQSTPRIPGILYTHLETKKVIGDPLIAEHGLCQVISGKLLVTDAGQKKVFVPGDLLFCRKNFLARFTRQNDGLFPFRSITVEFNREALATFGRRFNLGYEEPFPEKDAVINLNNSLLLENYFQTLLPYFNTPVTEGLVNYKQQEALLLLLQINPAFKNILFDLDQPPKTDLETFMQQHFGYNVEMKTLAYLSGRSLATFKRDFEKAFHTNPNRWLQERRLQEAYFLIREMKKRPSEVYQDVGFDTLTHFTTAFKQFYGVSPSKASGTKK